MKISFILCPFWHTEAPPLGIGYLSSYLKSKKYKTFSFDFNIDLYSKKKKHLMMGWDFHLPDTKRRSIFNKTFFKNDNFLNKEINSWVNKILDTNSQVICFTVYFENQLISLELAKRIKEKDPSKKIIFGGPFCRKNNLLDFYEPLFQQGVVDVFVMGEGEETLYKILKRYKEKGCFKPIKGTIQINGYNKFLLKHLIGKKFPLTLFQRYIIKKIYNGIQNPIQDLDKLPFPDFSDFPLNCYTKKDRVYFLSSRGCTGQCSFCRDRNIWPEYYSRSAENIFKEMMLRKEQGYTFLRFSDLIINGNLKNLDQLCNIIIRNKLNITWDGALKSNPRMNLAFFKKLKRAGYCGGNFSVESGSQKILNKMKKGHKIEVLEKNLRDMYHAGIGTSINIMVGFPGETDETIKQTLSFIHRNRKYILCLASLTSLYVVPESEVFNNPKKFDVKLGTNVENWMSIDKRNDYGWRIIKCKQIFNYVSSLGIRAECDQFKKDINSYNLNKK